MEVSWNAAARHISIGHPDQLAQEAVTRFLQHIEQGDEVKATADLSDSSRSILNRAPVLASYFKNLNLYNEILGMESEPEKEGTIRICADQNIWDEEGVGEYQEWYDVHRMPDGQWKILDSSLFH